MEISIPARSSRQPLPRLVDELIDIGATLSQIVSHMALSGDSRRVSPEAPPVDAVLRGILEDVLAPVLEEHGPKTLATAADVVGHAGRQIASEVVLVPLGEGSDEPEGLDAA